MTQTIFSSGSNNPCKRKAAAKRLGIPNEGVHTLEKYWHAWASATDPGLSKKICALPIETHKQTLTTWLKNAATSPLLLSADSKAEGLAFSSLFDADEFKAEGYKHKVIVFSSAESLKRLSAFHPNLFR